MLSFINAVTLGFATMGSDTASLEGVYAAAYPSGMGPAGVLEFPMFFEFVVCC